MAKKKVAKARSVPKAKARGTKKQSHDTGARFRPNGPARRTAQAPKRRPKTPPLPGMENKSKLSPAMLRIMDAWADQLHIANEAEGSIKGLRFNALAQMKRDNLTVAKEHGIELVRVPGEEKIRARLVKGEGATDADPDEGPIETDADADELDNGAGDEAMELAEADA